MKKVLIFLVIGFIFIMTCASFIFGVAALLNFGDTGSIYSLMWSGGFLIFSFAGGYIFYKLTNSKSYKETR